MIFSRIAFHWLATCWRQSWLPVRPVSSEVFGPAAVIVGVLEPPVRIHLQRPETFRVFRQSLCLSLSFFLRETFSSLKTPWHGAANTFFFSPFSASWCAEPSIDRPTSLSFFKSPLGIPPSSNFVLALHVRLSPGKAAARLNKRPLLQLGGKLYVSFINPQGRSLEQREMDTATAICLRRVPRNFRCEA